MIDVRNLSLSFGELEVLKDISFRVDRGQIVAILGRSGCGKSTLLRCISGLESGYEGTIRAGEMPLSTYLENTQISLVSQKYSNFHWLTARGNLGAGRPTTEDELSQVLEEVGLSESADRFVNNLSGGMQQRVAIGRALLQQTEIIVFDEPFGALDLITRNSLQDLLKRERLERQKTYVFVTHDVEEAVYLADQIIVLGSEPTTIIECIRGAFSNDLDHSVKTSGQFLETRVRIEEMLMEQSNGN